MKFKTRQFATENTEVTEMTGGTSANRECKVGNCRITNVGETSRALPCHYILCELCGKDGFLE